MRVLFLTRYDATGPSSRYRVIQFLPFLDRAGIRWELQPLVDSRYLDARFSGRRAGAGYLAARAWTRAHTLLGARRYDVVFVQKEIFPWAPPVAEWLLELSHARVILDIDDAIHLPYRNHALLSGKIPAAITRASLVLAGNHWLEAYARRFNPHTLHFPTVVDTDRFTPAAANTRRDGVVVGWMGSPETVGYLSEIAPALASVYRRAPFTLRVVGARHAPVPGIPVETEPWSYDTEAEMLRGFDVGVMPLRDDEWARGKCSLKLLQYMSAGCATVSSPRGNVEDIITDGENGFVAATAGDWERTLACVVTDAAVRIRMGANARRWVEENYSLARQGPRFVDAIRSVAEGRDG